MRKYFGKQAQDNITGFKGIITAYMLLMSGHEQFYIEPIVNDEDEEGR